MNRRVYIAAASQISIQKPLSEEWMTHPLRYDEPYVRCADPDFRQFFSPMQARRMGLLMKRAVTVSRAVMEASGIGCPDAIVTGTGLGCLENTKLFLDAMLKDGEQSLSPTPFMQSTHNTISSLIAIQMGCKCYNCTYSQGDISFESALLDAFIQLQSGAISNALVGSHDETTPTAAALLQQSGYASPDAPLSEASVATVIMAEDCAGGTTGSSDASLRSAPPFAPLTVPPLNVPRVAVSSHAVVPPADNREEKTESERSETSTRQRVPSAENILCELADVRILWRPKNLVDVIGEYGAEYVMESNEYQALFGRNCSASGLGTYAAAHLIAAGRYSSVLVVNEASDNVGLVYLRKPCGDC